MRVSSVVLIFSTLLIASGCGANIQACDAAKGAVIEACLNMQIGAVGMSKCANASDKANLACGRTDLTPTSILQEASEKFKNK